MIKCLFGAQFGLERRLPIALQFVTFAADQRALLKKESDLPPHIVAMMDAFEDRPTPEEQADPQFAYRVLFVPKTANRAGTADAAIEFIRPDSEEALAINQVFLKEVEKKKCRPGQIVEIMHTEGYKRFNMHHHTVLWKKLKANDPKKAYGVKILDGQWCWYESWLILVLEHCKENSALYR